MKWRMDSIILFSNHWCSSGRMIKINVLIRLKNLQQNFFARLQSQKWLINSWLLSLRNQFLWLWDLIRFMQLRRLRNVFLRQIRMDTFLRVRVPVKPWHLLSWHNSFEMSLWLIRLYFLLTEKTWMTRRLMSITALKRIVSIIQILRRCSWSSFRKLIVNWLWLQFRKWLTL